VDPTTRARQLCLDEETAYGCAEATFAALQEHFGIPDFTDSSEAMALNGGIAYSGGPCGALIGAALTLGRLASARIPERPLAKRSARGLMQELMAAFTAEFGSTQCRELTGFDLEADHDEFVASGVWETRCQAQIEFAISRIASLTDLDSWEAALTGVVADHTTTPAPVD